MNRNDVIIFELCAKSQSSYEDKTGHRRNTTKSFAIPATATILYTDKDGDSYIRNIRYVKSHKSVFTDVQQIDLDPTIRITRQVSKPQFTDGLLAVKKSQSNLLEFLRYHPYNEKNQHWGLDRQKTVFREVNPVEIAKKSNAANKQVVNASRLVYDSDFKGKIVPIAKYLGFDTTREVDLILWDVDSYARNNPTTFIELLDNPVIQRFSDLSMAIDMGIIRLDGQRVVWADGRQIVEAPANHDTLNFFSEVSFDEKYFSAWNEISRLLSKRTTPEEDAERIANPKSSQQEVVDSPEDIEALTAKLREQKIIGWKTPYFTIGNDKVKGKKDLYEYVSRNKARLVSELE